MKNNIISFVLILGMLAFASAASATPNRVTATNSNSGTSALIPAHAVQVSGNVFDLGFAIDQDSGDVVQGYAIVHYKDRGATPKDGQAKPDGTPGGGKKDKGGSGGSSCYTYLAKGAKWKGTPEPWIVNTSNPYGLSSASVFNILDNGITKWEDAADYNILGKGSVTATVLEADETSTDGLNEVYFAELEPGTIGVTIVWGIFGGPPSGRQLVEWDQVYNTYYAWSDTGGAGKMDFDNIATHELGHSVGLGDLYDSGCSEETMYGYGDYGETYKRDLNAGDIAGVSSLYN